MPQRAPAGRIELKPTQERVLAELKENGSTPLTRGRYEEIAGVSRSQAAYDLVELVEAGILERIGSGRATRYRLVHRDRPGQRRWTNERIRSALDDFCAERDAWPSASEFKAAGHSDLYVAASRYGGVGFWATELGFTRPGRATPPRAQRRSWWPRVRWAAAGAALAAVLIAAAGTAFVSLRDSPARQAAAPRAAPPAHTNAQAPKRAKAVVRARSRQVRKAPARSVHSLRRSSGGATQASTQLIVQREPVSSSSSGSRTPTQEQQRSAPSGPTPLPPPAGTGPGSPAPLPPPPRQQ